jgi:hypothetical protein
VLPFRRPAFLFTSTTRFSTPLDNINECINLYVHAYVIKGTRDRQMVKISEPLIFWKYLWCSLSDHSILVDFLFQRKCF